MKRLEQHGSCLDDALLVNCVSNSVFVEVNVWHILFSRIKTLGCILSKVSPVTDDEVIPHPFRNHSIFSVERFHLRTLVLEVRDIGLILRVCVLESFKDCHWCWSIDLLCTCWNLQAWLTCSMR
jgi:hypothetical protein